MTRAKAIAIFACVAAAFAFIVFSTFVKNEDSSDNGIVTKTTSQSSSAPWELNQVTKEQLMEIDGIGEVTAGRIIDYRSKIGGFTKFEQLLEVEGIGEKTLENMKDFLYLENQEITTVTTFLTSSFVTTTTENQTQSPVTTTVITTTTSVKTTTAPEITSQRRIVNINTASLEEIMEGLLLNYAEAEAIVRLRNDIQYFSNPLEILYATDKETGKDMFTFDEYNEFKDYVIVE